MKTRRPVDWPRAASALADLVPRDRLHPSVVAWAEGRPRTERWAVALSGGADSVALLLLLWAHWPKRRKTLAVLHFDHRLRGAESTADARFCGSLCRALKVTLVSGRWTQGRGTRSEGEARAGRFSFFDRERARLRVRALWFGHQQDDVAETMMMRLARGSGTAGLAAPRAIHSFADTRGFREHVHLRPLLGLKKSEIARALRKAGAGWREDSSNAKETHFRNRIRLSVINRWVRASGRDALAGAGLSRELLEEDDLALEAWVDALKPIGAGNTLLVARLAGRPKAVVRRALHRWMLLQPKAGELSRRGFESLMAAVRRGTPSRHSLGREGFAVIRLGRMRFEQPRRTARPH